MFYVVFTTNRDYFPVDLDSGELMFPARYELNFVGFMYKKFPP
jgi:hypothetical protein